MFRLQLHSGSVVVQGIFEVKFHCAWLCGGQISLQVAYAVGFHLLVSREKIVDLFIFIWQLYSELLIVTTWASSLQTSANALICSHCSNVRGGGGGGSLRD